MDIQTIQRGAPPRPGGRTRAGGRSSGSSELQAGHLAANLRMIGIIFSTSDGAILSLKAGILSLPSRVTRIQSLSFFLLALRLSVKSKPASGRGLPLLSRPLPFTPWQRAQASFQYFW